MTNTTCPTAFAFGFGIRFALHSHPESETFYILEDMFVVLSVCFLSFSAEYPKRLRYLVAMSLYCGRLHYSGSSSSLPTLGRFSSYPRKAYYLGICRIRHFHVPSSGNYSLYILTSAINFAYRLAEEESLRLQQTHRVSKKQDQTSARI